MSSHIDSDADNTKTTEPDRKLRLIQGERPDEERSHRFVDKTKRPLINQLRAITIPPWLTGIIRLRQTNESWASVNDDATAVTTESTIREFEAPPHPAPLPEPLHAEAIIDTSRSEPTVFLPRVSTRRNISVVIALVAAVVTLTAIAVFLEGFQNGNRTQRSLPRNDVQIVPAVDNAASVSLPPVRTSLPTPEKTNTVDAPGASTTQNGSSRISKKRNISGTAAAQKANSIELPKAPLPSTTSTSAFDTPIRPPSE